MAGEPGKVCFVVMGFGKKTDYESGRVLDMDATFEAIIRPAVTAAHLRCIRADEIMHSGLIDRPMYEMLLRADLVIADISTGNVNAVYELGVRHALRPHSTIIIKESGGKLSFDLNHVSTLHYEHLGLDIGNREAKRASEALGKLIKEVMDAKKADSPVYTFLPRLEQPTLSDERFAKMLNAAVALQGRLGAHVTAGDLALRNGEHRQAAIEFKAANELKEGDPEIVQKWALATYKAKYPDEGAALLSAIEILKVLQPESSNDPETLGLSGAIRKRLWLLHRDKTELDAAIRFYGRGFELMRDYYNGENLATCYDYRADIQTDPHECMYDRMCARKVRQAVIELLSALILRPSFSERSDQKWVHATFANCYFALGRTAQGEEHERSFRMTGPRQWEIDTFEFSKQAVLQNVGAFGQ